MFKKIAKLFGIKIGIIISLIALLVLFSFLWANSIGNSIKSKLVKDFNATLNYSKIRFSLLNKFPNISISLENAVLITPYQNSVDTLFACNKLDAILNTSKLILNQQVEVIKIELDKPILHIKEDSTLQTNYSCFLNPNKDSTLVQDSSITDIFFKIDYIDLNQANIFYQSDAQKINLRLLGTDIKGNFSIVTDSLLAGLEVNSLNFTFERNNKTLLNNDNLIFNTTFSYIPDSAKIKSKQTKITINGLILDFIGEVQFKENSPLYLDFSLIGNRIPVHLLGNFLPPMASQHFENSKSEGVLYLNLACKGLLDYDKNIFPLYKLETKIDNAKIQLTEIEHALDHINFDLSVHNDSTKFDKHFISLKQLYIKSDKDYIKGNLDLIIDHQYTIDSKLNINIDFEHLKKFFNTDSFFIGGKVEASASINGVYNKKKNYYPNFDAKLKIVNGKCKYYALPDSIIDIYTSLKVSNKSKKLDKLTVSSDSLFCRLGTDPLEGSFSITGIKNPLIVCDLKTNIGLEEIEKFYPIQGLKMYGKAELKLKTEGELDIDKKLIPKTSFVIKVKDGLIINTDNKTELKDFNLFADVINLTGNIKDTKIGIYSLKFKSEQNAFSAYGIVKNLDSPNLDFKMKGKLNLANINKIFNLKIDVLDGYIDTDLLVKLKWQDVIDENYDNIVVNGTLSTDNIEYQDLKNGYKFGVSDMNIKLSPTKISIQKIVGTHSNGKYTIKGNLNNYLDFISKKQKPKADLFFSVDTININKYYKPDKSDIKKTFDFSPYELMDLNLQLFVKNILYDTFNLRNASGTVLLKKNKITFFDVGFDIFNGQFFFNTTLDYQYKEQPILNLKVDAKNIDIKKSLYALNHIKKVKDEPSVSGNISLKYKLTIPLDSYLDFNSASIVGVGSFAVNNLRMKGHKVMKGMSKLTNKKQFDDGEFENIEIFTDIRDGKIFFNPFTMKVSGFTTDIEGYHSFTDGKMYYILKIIIPPFDLVKIPILITGTSDNPSVNFGSGDENVRKFIDSLNIKSRLVD